MPSQPWNLGRKSKELATENFQRPKFQVFLYMDVHGADYELQTQREHVVVLHISWAATELEGGGEAE